MWVKAADLRSGKLRKDLTTKGGRELLGTTEPYDVKTKIHKTNECWGYYGVSKRISDWPCSFFL